MTPLVAAAVPTATFHPTVDGGIAMDAASVRVLAEAAFNTACAEFHPTDVGNGKRFAVRQGDRAKYCGTRKTWYRYTGTRWEADPGRKVRELAKETAIAINAEVVLIANDSERMRLQRWARESEAHARINAMLDMASTDPAVSVEADDLDANPDLFNLQNGTLNLKTLEIQPHEPADLITKMAGIPYVEGATCPMWEAHIHKIFNGNPELIAATQELLGYSLIVGNPLQIFPIWWGGGRNGKSVTINTVRMIMGDYAATAHPSVFMAKKNEDGGPRPELLKMRGSRLVVAIETEDGARLNESLIKQMTGGDNIVARGIFSNDVEEWAPTHTAILVTNPLPIVRGLEDAIWARLKYWPFTVKIPDAEQIADYELILFREEGPGILNWILAGLRRYYDNGNKIAFPPDVVEATAKQRCEMDELGPFLLEQFVKDPDGRVMRKVIYDRYVEWCREDESPAMSKRLFAKALQRRGLTDGGKMGDDRTWRGIRLKTRAEHESDEVAGSVQARF